MLITALLLLARSWIVLRSPESSYGDNGIMLCRPLPFSSTSLIDGAESIYISYTDDETSLNEIRHNQYQLHIEAMRLPREREKCILYDLDTS